MQYFGDNATGKPVSNGFVYVGLIDQDPEIEANRITVNITQEDGSIVPIAPSAQPLTIGPGGFIQYLGSPVQVNAASEFSIKVTDSAGVKAYYVPRVSNTISANIVTYDNTTSGLSAIQAQAAIDEIALLTGAVTAWGGIAGDILNQTDLQAQFAQNKRLDIYTLSTATELAILAHANSKINMTNSGASTYQIDAGIFTKGDQIIVEQEGTGKVTIVQGAGVTINSNGGLIATSGQYAVVALIHDGSDIWTLAGDRA